MSKLDDPVFVRYWMLQFRLEELHDKFCLNCSNYCWCWRYEGACYDTDSIYKLCRNKEVIKTIMEIRRTVDKRGILYFGATMDEYVKLEEMFKRESEPPKYFDSVSYEGILVVAGVIADPREISLWQKIKAILGLNDEIGFCSKHRIYFYHESVMAQINQNMIYVCPLCFKTIKKKITVTSGDRPEHVVKLLRGIGDSPDKIKSP